MSFAEKLVAGYVPTQDELTDFLSRPSLWPAVCAAGGAAARARFGRGIYLRGLIELSSYCKNNCLYCGIRAANTCAARYRLSDAEILSACGAGYANGIRTFVLQGGEDAAFTDDRVCALIRAIKKNYPNCAVTLSLGERSTDSYRALYEAGADRYLLRHEAADEALYAKLHPPTQQYAARMECLAALRGIGFQTGVGFMVGAPFQTTAHIAQELLFIHAFRPQMIGIGPFIPHAETPLSQYPPGSAALCVVLLALLRLLERDALIPATTALATVAPDGREQGILAGANVVMPNLSPPQAAEKYKLYDNKAFETLADVRQKIKNIGYEPIVSRGDYICTQ